MVRHRDTGVSTARTWPANPGLGGAIVPRRRDGVQSVEIDSESVLYDERNDRLHLLNWSASAVWWSIDGTATADELATDLAAVFGAAPQTMRDDVLGLLTMLGARDLIEPGGIATGRPSDG